MMTYLGFTVRLSPFEEIKKRKEKQFLRRFFIIMSIILGVKSEENCSVSWQLTTVPIFFGVDIHLKCMTSGSRDCFGSGIFKWIGGPDKELISFDVQVFDRTKYSAFHKGGDYWLIIKNVSARDLDIPYACHCGFYNLETILKNISIHSDDKELSTLGDKQQKDMGQIQEDKRYQVTGSIENTSYIAGVTVGAIISVLVVFGVIFAIYKRYKKRRGGLNGKKQTVMEENVCLNSANKNDTTEI